MVQWQGRSERTWRSSTSRRRSQQPRAEPHVDDASWGKCDLRTHPLDTNGTPVLETGWRIFLLPGTLLHFLPVIRTLPFTQIHPTQEKPGAGEEGWWRHHDVIVQQNSKCLILKHFEEFLARFETTNEQISSPIVNLSLRHSGHFLVWIQTVWSLKEKFTLLGEKELIQRIS